MSIKIRKNGVVEDLVINATEVQVLDVEDNFRSKNLESILKEIKATGGDSGTGGGMLKEAEYVFVGDKEPEFEGVWLDTSENNNESEGISDNGIVKELKNYVDKNIKDASYSKEKLLNDEIVNLDTNTQKQLKITNIKGKTIVNLLGRDGSCEDISKWENVNSTHELNSGDKVFGNNGFKVITTQNKRGACYLHIDNIINISKWYCISAYVKNGNAENCGITLWNGVEHIYSNKISDDTKFNRIYLKTKPSDFISEQNASCINFITYGELSGRYAYVDGVMLEEITEEQYNDSNFKPSEYVESDLSVGENPTKIKIVGKNLLNLDCKNFNKVNYNEVMKKITVSKECWGRWDKLNTLIYLKPNTTYTLSCDINNIRDGSGRLSIFSLTNNMDLATIGCIHMKNSINKNQEEDYSEWNEKVCSILYKCDAVGKSNIRVSVVFTTNNCTQYKLGISGGVRPQIYDDNIFDEYWNVQLEEGDKATEYEEYEEAYIDVPVLRSLPNGICDEYIDGKFIKRIEKVMLDGNTGEFTLLQVNTGVKVIGISNILNNPNNFLAKGMILKYNNKNIFGWKQAPYTKEYGWIESTNQRIWLVIPNTDSGWGDSYTPTQDEIKAYFYGWKMSTDQGNSYNGTGVKCWTPFSRVGMNTDSQLTLPTGYSKYTFTPYRLYYQLATPIIKELNQPQLMIEPNGQLQVESYKESWVRPNNGVAYIIADNIKANLDELEYGVYKNSKEINSIDERINTISNPNLLINPDFRIWQRGTSFESGVYTTDRWMLKSDTKAVAQKTDNGIRITAKQDGTWTNFSQFIEKENFKKLKGQTLTLTFKTTQPTNMVNQIWGLSIGGKYIFNRYFSENEYSDIFSVTFKLDEIRDVTEIGIQLRSKAGVTIELEYAKLEVGDKVTPFVSRNCRKELALCQRYYEVMPRLIGHTSYGIDFIRGFWYFREQKRTTPTIKYSFNGIENEIGYVDKNVGKIFQKPFAKNGSYTDKDMFCLEGCLGITNYFQWEATIIADSEIYI